MPRGMLLLPLVLTALVVSVVLGSSGPRAELVEPTFAPGGPRPRPQPAGERHWLEVRFQELPALGDREPRPLRAAITAAPGPGGDIFVLDWGDPAIRRFSADGRLLRSYRWPGAAAGGAPQPPFDFALGTGGEVWAAYTDFHRVQVFDPGGGTRAELDLETPPHRIATAADGSFVVLTGGRAPHLFQSYGPGGEPRRAFGRLLAGEIQERVLLDGRVAGDGEGAFVYAPYHAGLLASYTFEGELRFLVETLGAGSRTLPRMLIAADGSRRLEPGSPRHSLAVRVAGGYIYVLSERESEAARRRILDIYDNADGTYLRSIRLPNGPRDAFVAGDLLYTVHRDHLARWRLNPPPGEAIAASTAPASEHTSGCEVGHLATLSGALLERPIALVPGLGEARQEVSTESAAARNFYHQGLAHLASFDWVGAARSFHESLRRDPGLAMARLGLARAYLGLESPARADRHAREAVRLAARREIPDQERKWIELGAAQMRAVLAAPEHSRRELGAYQAALERHLERYPDDIHALVLRGNAESRADGWGQAGREGSPRWYRKALELDPDHFPAHHFLAHSYENLGRHREAWEHARRYAELAPAAPHAHHMLAHVEPRLGRWRQAREHLETAHRLHRASFAAGALAPEEDWHYGHNLRLLAAVRLRLGDEAGAEALLRETFRMPYGGRRAGFYCLPWIEHLLSRERFREAGDAARSCQARDSRLAGVVGAALEGEAALGLGRIEQARSALARARDRFAALAAAPRATSSEGTFLFVARQAVRILEGKLLLRDDPAAGEALLLDVARTFAAGTTFDAWALGRPRVEEVAGHARRAGHPALAAAVGEHLERLDGALPPPPAARGGGA